MKTTFNQITPSKTTFTGKKSPQKASNLNFTSKDTVSFKSNDESDSKKTEKKSMYPSRELMEMIRDMLNDNVTESGDNITEVLLKSNKPSKLELQAHLDTVTDKTTGVKHQMTFEPESDGEHLPFSFSNELGADITMDHPMPRLGENEFGVDNINEQANKTGIKWGEVAGTHDDSSLRFDLNNLSAEQSKQGLKGKKPIVIDHHPERIFDIGASQELPVEKLDRLAVNTSIDHELIQRVVDSLIEKGFIRPTINKDGNKNPEKPEEEKPKFS
jgi:predicted transcriptional regulator